MSAYFSFMCTKLTISDEGRWCIKELSILVKRMVKLIMIRKLREAEISAIEFSGKVRLLFL